MKFISYFLGLVFTASVFIACDDDLNNVGASIIPKGDEIEVAVDTFDVKIRTIKVDSLYAWSTTGLLGKYEDDIFGSIKSDYMTEFYCYNASFLSDEAIIDSVQLDIDFYYHYGDTLAPMGLSVYKLTNQLNGDFYTNIDPKKYCDMSQMLGQQIYTIAQTATSTTSSGLVIRTLTVDLNKKVGEEFYTEYLTNKNTFSNSDTFRDFFPGVYVTPTLGANTLVEAGYTTLNIYYKYDTTYTPDSSDVVRDTTYHKVFSLEVSADVIQLNHVENKVPSNLLQEGTGASYIKSPAGVCLELEFPIMDVKNWLGDDTTKILNSASFKLLGYTEKEDLLNSPWGKPSSLLLVDKDSLETFFRNKKYIDNKYSTIISRTASTNIYDFGNISSIIKEYKKRDLQKNPIFVLIPVSYNSSTYEVRNYLRPLSAIVRTEDKYMKMGVMSTKY